MKGQVKRIRLLLILMVLSGLYGGIRFYVPRWFPIAHVICSCDHRLVEYEQKKIEFCMQQLMQGRTINYLAHAGQQLREQFPYLASVSLAYLPGNCVYGEAITQEPYMLINDQYMITKNGILVTKNIVPSSRQNHLPTIHVADTVIQQSSAVQLMYRALAKLPSALFHQYECTWQDTTHAWLCDKQHPGFILLFNAYTLPDDRMQAAVEQIKQKLLIDGTVLDGIKQRIVADIRFADQIILCTEKGGR
jgi:hypothetical protein